MKPLIVVLALASALSAAEPEGQRDFITARRVVVESDVRLCGLHQKPLLIGSGFAARPPDRVSAQSLREIVSFVYSYECPNRKPWYVFATPISTRDIPTSFEHCSECDTALDERLARWKEKAPTSEEFKKLLEERERREPNQSPSTTRFARG